MLNLLLYKKHLQLASEKYGTSLQFDSLTCFMGPPILDTKDMTGRARQQSFWKNKLILHATLCISMTGVSFQAGKFPVLLSHGFFSATT